MYCKYMLESKWTICNHGWQKIAVEAGMPKFGQTWDRVTWLTSVKRQIRGWGLSLWESHNNGPLSACPALSRFSTSKTSTSTSYVPINWSSLPRQVHSALQLLPTSRKERILNLPNYFGQFVVEQVKDKWKVNLETNVCCCRTDCEKCQQM